MKLRFNRNVIPVSFPTEPDEPDSYGDITVSKGKITIKGKTLAKIERLAAAAGLSVPAYVNRLILEELLNPERLERLIREQVRECRRVSSWCERRRYLSPSRRLLP